MYMYMALGLNGQPRHPMIAKRKQMMTGFSINVVQYTAFQTTATERHNRVRKLSSDQSTVSDSSSARLWHRLQLERARVALATARARAWHWLQLKRGRVALATARARACGTGYSSCALLCTGYISRERVWHWLVGG